MGAQLLNVLIGIWLTAAPGVLQLGGKVAVNEHITGPVVASVALIAVNEATRNVRYVNLMSGLWLLLAPWLLSYKVPGATLNEMLAGALLIGFSLVKGRVNNRFGGGWRSLWAKQPAHQRAADCFR